MKNKYISYLTLIAMFFVNIQVFHHHDLDLSNENVLNHNVESIINEDIHKCDLCKLGYTKFFLTEDIFLFNEVFSSSCSIVQPKAYFYKEIYKISNKSPPLV